jgi:hypothetical protein
MVLAPTEPARRYIAARGRPHRVYMVPPGVDVDRFDWDEPPEEGAPIILYVGTLSPGRGARILLRSLVDVVRRADARLVLAGPVERDFRDSLLDGIANLGLRGKVHLVGEVAHDQVPALIAQATVCVTPAAVELSPKPTALYPTRILEYMACRRPVVAPRRGTVTMFMREGVDGLLFTPGDPEDLARQIGALLQDRDLRERLSASGYEMVRREHTASATRRAVRAAYRALASMSPWRDRFSQEQPESPPSGVPHLPIADITEALEMDDLQEETDENARPFEAVDLPSGDLTRVDPRGDELTSVDLRRGAEPGMLDSERTRRWLDEGGVTEPNVRAESWVVEPTGTTAALLVDDDGTPVDIEAIPAKTPPLETRFVAGEVEVPTPKPEDLEPAGDEMFTAVSVLLGTRDDEPPPSSG